MSKICGTTVQIHHQAGAHVLTMYLNQSLYQGSQLLAQEKSCHQEYIALPCKSYTRKQS